MSLPEGYIVGATKKHFGKVVGEMRRTGRLPENYGKFQQEVMAGRFARKDGYLQADTSGPLSPEENALATLSDQYKDK